MDGDHKNNHVFHAKNTEGPKPAMPPSARSSFSDQAADATNKGNQADKPAKSISIQQEHLGTNGDRTRSSAADTWASTQALNGYSDQTPGHKDVDGHDASQLQRWAYETSNAKTTLAERLEKSKWV